MHGITMAANGARELVATAGKAGMKAARWCGPGSCSSRGGGEEALDGQLAEPGERYREGGQGSMGWEDVSE